MERRVDLMARAIMRLRRIVTGKIYRAVKAGSSRRWLCPQHSPRCVSVVIISDASCSICSKLKEISREEMERIVDALKTEMEKINCERPVPCANIRCDGHKKHGKGKAGIIYLFLNRRLDRVSGPRLLYYLDRTKRNAQWYREGPPNSNIICHNMNTAA